MLDQTTQIEKSNHRLLNNNYDFYENLNDICKNNLSVKLFPDESKKEVKKIWQSKFGKNNINFIEDISSKKIFYKAKLLVLDVFSTAFYEALYIGVPFIVLTDKNFYSYKKDFIRYLKILKRLNILHFSSSSAANFVNKNYENLFEWWKFVDKDKRYINLKKKLFVEKENYIFQITNELSKAK